MKYIALLLMLLSILLVIGCGELGIRGEKSVDYTKAELIMEGSVEHCVVTDWIPAGDSAYCTISMRDGGTKKIVIYPHICVRLHTIPEFFSSMIVYRLYKDDDVYMLQEVK